MQMSDPVAPDSAQSRRWAGREGGCLRYPYDFRRDSGERLELLVIACAKRPDRSE